MSLSMQQYSFATLVSIDPYYILTLWGVTNHWTEVDWTGLDSQKCQK